MSENFIDYRFLMAKYSEEELARTAEEYFANLTNIDFHITKPFSGVDGVSSIVGDFSALLHGAELFNGCKVLDFGAGAGWTSRYMAQMGCTVLAVEVSKSAVAIGQQMLKKLPLIGDYVGTVEFQIFDGHKIQSPENSIDRIVIMDAFHHISNQEHILSEFKRVLRPGGFVVMSEPGPNHSRTDQAQSEMKKYRVLERDVVIEEIEDMSKRVGFAAIEVGIYCPIPTFETTENFSKYLFGGDDKYLALLQKNYLENHRLVRIRTEGKEIRDSRHREGLKCGMKGRASENKIVLEILNNGSNVWLPSGDSPGSVNLGIHQLNPDGTVKSLGIQRINLSREPVHPGEKVKLEILVSDLNQTESIALDLVAEQIAWFSWNGCEAFRP